MAENIIDQKSFAFAVRIVQACKKLTEVKKEYVISKQLLRAGTSIGANVQEAVNAQTKRDFIYKLSTSQKECGETIFWLRLLHATEYFTEVESNSLQADANELLRIIRRIIMTARKNLNENHIGK